MAKQRPGNLIYQFLRYNNEAILRGEYFEMFMQDNGTYCVRTYDHKSEIIYYGKNEKFAMRLMDGEDDAIRKAAILTHPKAKL